MLKIGVLGAGHLGKIHMKCIRELPEIYEFAGFFDTNVRHAKEAADQFGIMPFYSMESLMDSVDVVDIVTPTTFHYDCASAAIRKFKHTFIEKPVTVTMDEARALIKLAKEAE